jgi:biotin transport system substrate-specific component
MHDVTFIIDRYREFRLDVYRRRSGSGMATMVFLSLMMSCLTGICAQISIYLPWTPVPVTGQTLAVLLAGIVLGRWGALSQVFYIAIGIAGVPWFAGAQGGAAVMMGPTFGYIIGFVAAAYFVGLLMDRYVFMRRLVPLIVIMLMANFIIILGIGTLYLYVWLIEVKGEIPVLVQLLWMGAIPFIPGAVVKTILAALTGTAIMPKENIGTENMK